MLHNKKFGDGCGVWRQTPPQARLNTSLPETLLFVKSYYLSEWRSAHIRIVLLIKSSVANSFNDVHKNIQNKFLSNYSL